MVYTFFSLKRVDALIRFQMLVVDDYLVACLLDDGDALIFTFFFQFGIKCHRRQSEKDFMIFEIGIIHSECFGFFDYFGISLSCALYFTSTMATDFPLSRTMSYSSRAAKSF